MTKKIGNSPAFLAIELEAGNLIKEF